jgi:hypothetical protein
VGAVAGTPGTLPTNWGISGTGTLTHQIVATGVVNGINYIDIRLSGTTSTTQASIRFESSSGASGTNGQTFTYSAWFARVDGSLSNVTGIACNANLYDAATAYITTPAFTGFDSTVQPTSLIRRAGTLTIASATSAFIQPQIVVTFNSGVAIDITLRIGLPQLELGAFATSVIPTTTAAATRAADVASITGSAFSSWYRQDEGTVFTDCSINYTVPGTSFPIAASLFDGTSNNRIENGFLTSTLAGYEVATGGVAQVGMYPNAGNSLTRRLATSFKFNDFAASVNGGIINADTSGTIPTIDQLRIGARTGAGGTSSLFGTIRRLVYWGQRLPNNVLQAITQ